MLTPRESAAGVCTAVRGMGRGNVKGAHMGEVTAARIAFADNAITAGRQSFVPTSIGWRPSTGPACTSRKIRHEVSGAVGSTAVGPPP